MTVQKTTSEWLPIQCAPLDGSRILLTDGKNIAIGRWLTAVGIFTGEPVSFWSCDGHELAGAHGGLDVEIEQPTKWMPLPELS